MIKGHSVIPMLLFIAVLLNSNQAVADEVYLKNGDRITGKLVRMGGSKLEMETAYAGIISIEWNQVSRLIGALEETDFGLIEVEEIMLRPYKVVPARLRPMDRMVAHTGYLIFARALIPLEE